MNRVPSDNGHNGHAAGQGNGDVVADVALTPADAAAIDAILDRTEESFGVDPSRKLAATAFLAVLGKDAEPAPPSDLLARTLVAIQTDRMRIPAAASAAPDPALQKANRSRWRRHFAEVAAMAVAAGLFIAVTVDLLGIARQSQKRIACQANLQKIGVAMAAYAGDSSGDLPMLATPENGNWLHGTGAGAPRNNSANLIPLIVGSYIPVTALFCAGAGLPAGPVQFANNALPEIGYSYRNLYGPAPAQWDGQVQTILLSDRNPVFVELDSGGGGNGAKPAVAKHNSLNHNGHGNYLLRSDQSVSWEVSPNAGPDGDNIWTLGTGKDQIATFQGTENPRSATDVFMCP